MSQQGDMKRHILAAHNAKKPHKCKICEKIGHFPDACRKGQTFGQKTPKKARVNVLTAEEKGGETAVVLLPAEAAAEPGAQAAALNSKYDPTSSIRKGTLGTNRKTVDGCLWRL